MEKIIILKRTNKGKKDEIQLRFRLRDGRAVDLFYKSDITTTLEKLDKFEADGELKPKTTIFDTQLRNAISETKEAILKVYGECKALGIVLDSAQLTERVNSELNPEKVERTDDRTMLGQFRAFYQQYEVLNDEGKNTSLVFRDYQVLDGKLERYLKIIGQESMLIKEFTDRELMAFHRFMIEEYKYVAKSKYRYIYEDMKERNVPKKPRSQNTVATDIKKMRTFFNWYAKKNDDFGKTPFERLTDAELEKITSEEYDDAIYLVKEEFLKVYDAEVPAALQETKDAFILQCNFGARIEDFKKLGMKNVMVDPSGIPYIRYLPHKTVRTSKEDIETPILRYSLDIIKKYRFQFPILKYVTGKSGYNAKIKELLKLCGIDRGCKEYNSKTESNDMVPLWSKASSKICRKTCVDMMTKVQLDKYAAGLHKVGSGAVDRYTNMSLRDRFTQMCLAFNQPHYAVDKDLNVVEMKTDLVDDLQQQADALKALIAEKTASLPPAPKTQDEFPAWSKAMSEITTCNQQLHEINAKLIEELKK